MVSVLVLEVENDFLSAHGFELTIFDSANVEHAGRSFNFDAFARVVEIVEIDNFFNTGLDDGFGAIDAREVMHIDTRTLEIVGVATEVEDSVEFAMATIGVFGIADFFRFTNIPGH